jgi:hypothetical protein
MDVSYNTVSVFNSPTTNNIFAKFSNNGTYRLQVDQIDL